jgi:hypothetical protein
LVLGAEGAGEPDGVGGEVGSGRDLVTSDLCDEEVVEEDSGSGEGAAAREVALAVEREGCEDVICVLAWGPEDVGGAPGGEVEGVEGDLSGVEVSVGVVVAECEEELEAVAADGGAVLEAEDVGGAGLEDLG